MSQMLTPHHGYFGTGKSLTEHPYLKLPALDSDGPPPIKKPTLGVIPRRAWLHQRAVDLSNAIAKYTGVEAYSRAYNLIDELDEILSELRHAEKPQHQND